MGQTYQLLEFLQTFFFFGGGLLLEIFSSSLLNGFIT